jgi:hypothetical protein
MNPEVRCVTCSRTKDPMLHMRADHPPTAAKAWLKRTCKREGKPCDFGYRAGIDVEGLARAIKEKREEIEAKSPGVCQWPLRNPEKP